jgi:hypothetical protein
MYKLFEDFRRNVNERVGDKIIKVEAIMVCSKKQNLTVTDYLSRIRGIEGVTIVKALETLEKPLHNTTRVSLKIDGEYLPEASINSILERVRSQALSIEGVTRFTYTSLPQV